jgi:uncharacterized protein YggU (UPF0235/DUF167 family)
VSSLRIAVRVKPGASRTKVGGRYDGPSGPALVVAVSARAVDGKATEATLAAVAEAFGVRRRQVRLLSGPASRDKLVELDGPAEALRNTLTELLG